MKGALAGVLIVGAVAAGVAEAQQRRQGPPQPPVSDRTWELIDQARQAGYEDGYLDGLDAARGSPNYAQCQVALTSCQRRAQLLRKYEDCLGRLAGAQHGPEMLVRQAVAGCVSTFNRRSLLSR